jgi:hypothetical protein
MDDSFNFSERNKYHNFNRGELLSTLTYNVTAGVPIILKSKSLNNYKLIKPGELFLGPNDLYDYSVISLNSNGHQTYNLNTLAYSLNLGSNWQDYYEFYDFIPSSNTINTDNIIDWNKFNIDKQKYIDFLKNQNPQEYNNYLKWDGDDGMIEFIFSYLFYKGLQLI